MSPRKKKGIGGTVSKSASPKLSPSVPQEPVETKPAPDSEQERGPRSNAKQTSGVKKRLRVTGCTVIYDHTEYLAGSLLPRDFPDGERERLLKRGAVVEEGQGA